MDKIDIIRRVLSVVQMSFTLMNTIVIGIKSSQVTEYHLIDQYGGKFYLSTDKDQQDFTDCHGYYTQEEAESDLEQLSSLQKNQFGSVLSIINCIFQCIRSIIQAIVGKKAQGRIGDVLMFVEAYQTILSFFSYAFANVSVGFKSDCVSYVLKPQLTFLVTIFLMILTVVCSIEVLLTYKNLTVNPIGNLKSSFIVYTIVLVARVLIKGLQKLMQLIQNASTQNQKIFYTIVYMLALFLGFGYVGFCICLVIALFTQADPAVMVSTFFSTVTGQIGVIFECFFNNESLDARVAHLAQDVIANQIGPEGGGIIQP